MTAQFSGHKGAAKVDSIIIQQSIFHDGFRTVYTEGETLFIKGQLSDYIQPSHRETILTLFPKAAVKMIQNTGHWLHAEKPELFNALVLAFFE